MLDKANSRLRRSTLSARRILVACGLTVSLAACGSGDGPRTGVQLDAAADGSLRFQRTSLRAGAGRASIEMRNSSDLHHAIGIRGKGRDEVGATVGRDGSSRVTPDLRPGVYELFCPVGGTRPGWNDGQAHRPMNA